jgi:hypothetical protein
MICAPIRPAALVLIEATAHDDCPMVASYIIIKDRNYANDGKENRYIPTSSE